MNLKEIWESVQKWCKYLAEAAWFKNTMLVIIVVNAVTMGLETVRTIEKKTNGFLSNFDWFFVAVYTLEILIKLIAFKLQFFFDAWNVFDLIIIVFSYIGAQSNNRTMKGISSLRALRVLRIMENIDKLKGIILSIFSSLPSVAWASVLLFLFFYVYAIIGTSLYSNEFPEFFGTLFGSIFTLFQCMAFDGWSMEIARPVMEVHPWAPLYFVTFIIIASFFLLNVIVGIVVNTSETSEILDTSDISALSMSTRTIGNDYDDTPVNGIALDDLYELLAERVSELNFHVDVSKEIVTRKQSQAEPVSSV